MNQNYPEHILKKIREWNDMDENDNSRDDEWQELRPEDAFDRVLSYEGILGYRASILGWIEDIFKVKLMPYSGYQTKEDFVQGLSNIINANHSGERPLAMNVDEDDTVRVLFEDATVVAFKA